jgi:hypothetical protein
MGTNNTATGGAALFGNTSGNDNTASGFSARQQLTIRIGNSTIATTIIRGIFNQTFSGGILVYLHGCDSALFALHIATHLFLRRFVRLPHELCGIERSVFVSEWKGVRVNHMDQAQFRTKIAGELKSVLKRNL